jgi:hypothetical protein
MFGRNPKKPLSPYEQRAERRQAEYKRYGLTTYDEQMMHEERKALLGEDYRQRDTGTWRKAEQHLKTSHQSWWDWLWN